MKKILFLFFLLLIFPIISAVQIDFLKNNSTFDGGETIIAKVSGNFINPLNSDNVLFHKDGTSSNIPFTYNLVSADDDFYIYALTSDKNLQTLSGNYSISIENARYMSGVDISQEKIIKNFTITNQTADFSVAPGVVNTYLPFSIQIQNLQNNRITVMSSPLQNFNQSSTSINVQSGEIKTVDFQPSNQSISLSSQIQISSLKTSYTIPVFFNLTSTANNSNQTTSSGIRNGTSFDFQPNKITVSMPTNSSTKRIIYISNDGNSDINDLTFFVPTSLAQYIKISSPQSVKVNSSEKVDLTLNSDAVEKTITGTIIAQADNTTSEFDVILNFIKDYVPSESDNSSSIITSCTDLKGEVCSGTKVCSGNTASTRDGVCCLTSCEEPKKSSWGKIIGWSIVVLVLLFLIYFFKKYKRVRPKVDLLKVAEKR